MRRVLALLVLVVSFLCLPAAHATDSSTSANLSKAGLNQRVRDGIDLLNRTYWSPTLNIWLDTPGDDVRAHYDGRLNPPWWPSANAVETLIDYMDVTKTSDYQAAIEALYELQKDRAKRMERIVAELRKRNQWTDRDEQSLLRRQKRSAAASATPSPRSQYYTDFQNEYLDDSGWWGVTWLKMYSRTGDAKYLHTATTIHAHMARNWSPEKQGGVLWCEDEDKQHPNAITNGLFLLLSARLYGATHDAEYLRWAEKTFEWFHTAGLYDGTAIVDGIGHTGDYWSYNQGVYIGGLAALFQSTGRGEYLDGATKVAESVLTKAGLVLPDGVAVEKLGTGGDAALFKGVLIRYLAQLREVLLKKNRADGLAAEIDRCIRSSVESMLKHGMGADGLYSAEWHEGAKDVRTNFNTQVSALACLVAALEIAKD